MALSNQWINEEIKQQIKKKLPRDKSKSKHKDPKVMGHSKRISKGEFYNETSLPQETRKISNKQSNFTFKATRERRTNKTESYWKERNNNDQSTNK